MEPNSALAISPTSVLSSDNITPKVTKAVDDLIISWNNDQNVVKIQAKTKDSMQQNPSKQKETKIPATIKHTPI